MRKALLLIVGLLATATCVAQSGKLWGGDFRIGISGGVNKVLKAPHYNLGAQMSLATSERKYTPNIGLYFGLQKDLVKRLAWGIDQTLSVGKGGWQSTFLNTKYSLLMNYDIQQTMINERLGLHVAYFTGLHTQVQAGVGLYFDMYMCDHVNLTVTNATSAAHNPYGRVDNINALAMSYNAGMEFSLGATYYIGNSWFVKGDVHYMLPVFNSGEYFVPGFDYDNEINDMFTSLDDKKMGQVAAILVIGYLW